MMVCSVPPPAGSSAAVLLSVPSHSCTCEKCLKRNAWKRFSGACYSLSRCSCWSCRSALHAVCCCAAGLQLVTRLCSLVAGGWWLVAGGWWLALALALVLVLGYLLTALALPAARSTGVRAVLPGLLLS